MTTDELVLEIGRYCNSYNVPMDKFNAQMSREHRTLQQTFTKLCLSWIEHVASDEYRTDGRNFESKIICKDLIDLFNAKMESNGFDGDTLALMSKPSRYLGTI